MTICSLFRPGIIKSPGGREAENFSCVRFSETEYCVTCPILTLVVYTVCICFKKNFDVEKTPYSMLLLGTRNPQRHLWRLLLARPAGGWLPSLATTPGAHPTPTHLEFNHQNLLNSTFSIFGLGWP